MNNTATILVIIAILLIGAILLFWRGADEPVSVPIESNFGTKLVYTTDTATSTEPFITHCRQQGGTFSECGTICEPDAAVCAEVCAFTCEDIPLASGKVDTSSWEQFTNETYDFSLRYPANDWNKHVDTSFEFSPKFNFYLKPSGVPLDLPLDHFANVTHVSVYPKGIPTEGVVGQTKEFDFYVGMEVTEDSRIYVLEDGTPFAAFVKPVTPPQSWSEAGFIWMRLQVDNLETRCVRDGQEITEQECDPLLQNDQIIRTGTVDTDLWPIEQAIVEHLGFTPGSTITDIIQVTSPARGATIKSPVKVTGEARGTWYFEADFPIVLTDWDGRIIAEGFATAQGDWMTEDFVPFEAELAFESPYETGDQDFMRNGTLILQKANPSGLPENDAAFEIPVQFAPQTQ